MTLRGLASPTRSRPGRSYLAGAPVFVAHRGGAKLAPENTMEAFRRAVDWWAADILEMDVRLTKDGHVVVIHDPTVDRTTDGTGAVADLTLAQIQSYDAGYHFIDPQGRASFRGLGVRVPTLDSVMEAFPDARLNIEPKAAEAATPVVNMVRRFGAQHRVLVAAERERQRATVRDYGGPWGASRSHIFWFWALHRLPWGGPFTPDIDILQVPEVWKGLRVVDERFVREAHRRNIPVQIWTVNDPEEMNRLLDWGVDGLQTDRPDVLARLLTERFGRPPPPGPPST